MLRCCRYFALTDEVTDEVTGVRSLRASLWRAKPSPASPVLKPGRLAARRTAIAPTSSLSRHSLRCHALQGLCRPAGGAGGRGVGDEPRGPHRAWCGSCGEARGGRRWGTPEQPCQRTASTKAQLCLPLVLSACAALKEASAEICPPPPDLAGTGAQEARTSHWPTPRRSASSGGCGASGAGARVGAGAAVAGRWERGPATAPVGGPAGRCLEAPRGRLWRVYWWAPGSCAQGRQAELRPLTLSWGTGSGSP